MALDVERRPVKQGASADVTVVHFAGRHVYLDEDTLYRIHDELLALAEESSTSDVFLDFGNIEYLTSATLGTLVHLHKKLLARGRRLIIGNLLEQIHEVFKLTRLDRLLDLRPMGHKAETAAQSGRVHRRIETTWKGG